MDSAFKPNAIGKNGRVVQVFGFNRLLAVSDKMLRCTQHDCNRNVYGFSSYSLKLVD